jgi:hypothetical protein
MSLKKNFSDECGNVFSLEDGIYRGIYKESKEGFRIIKSGLIESLCRRVFFLKQR